MKNTLNLAGAFVGVIVGAGFGSGQEILQFFSNFGVYSLPAIVIATIIFIFIGMQIAQLGSHIHATSHKQIINMICGRYLGTAVDVLLSFFLFGVAVIMIAGAGSLLEQQFNIPAFYGALVMVVLAVLTLLLKTNKIISIISSFTPILLVFMVIVAAYSVTTNGIDFSEMRMYANADETAASHWIVSALLYVSFNIGVGFSMLSVIGGSTADKKQAARGGILGGFLLGLLLVLINIGMMADFKNVQAVPMPTLHLANSLSPVFGSLLAILLFAMIYNTCVGMFYAFTARFIRAETKLFKSSVVVVGATGFGLSFAGFTTLVNTIYPLMGYLGFILLGGVLFSWFRRLHDAPELFGIGDTQKKDMENVS
ncbi:MAG: hypothetical protein ACI4XL_12650 [Bacillus sp. (in: firmicutes)]